MFGQLDDALYDLVDRSASNPSFTVRIESVRILRKQRRAIQTRFLRRLHQVADAAASDPLEFDPRPDALPPNRDLAAIADAGLEEVLAIDTLVSKAESRYRRALLDMNAHLARLLDRPEVDLRSNPYGPFAICDAWRAALRAERELEPRVKLVVYGVFGDQVMDRLGDYYENCVELALTGGYVRGFGLTHFARGAVALRGRVAGRDPAKLAKVAKPRNETPSPSLPPPSVSTPFGIRQVSHGGQAASDDLQSDLAVLPTDELLALLSSLGVRALVDGDSSGARVRERLSSALAVPCGPRRAPSREDEATLDLVLRFFERLLHGNDLPDPIKALIERLQIPIAKLALMDKAFFSDAAHPARRLLNHIGEAALGWSEADGRGPGSLFGMIERVVERLILDFEGDLGLFAQMDRFFVAFIAYEQTQARVTEAKALAELAAGIADPDRQAVAAALESAIRPYPVVPAVVDAMLRQGMLPVLLAIYRTQGPESPAWRSALALAERLLWSVQPKTDAQERRKLLRRIPEILRSLRAHLAASGCDQRELSVWLRDLRALHMSAAQGAAEPGASVFASVDACGGALEGMRPGAADPPRLVLGGWIELTRDDGTKARLKLAWRSQDREEFLFVDRRGRRGTDLTRIELDALRKRGFVEVLGLGPEPIADRALRSALGHRRP